MERFHVTALEGGFPPETAGARTLRPLPSRHAAVARTCRSPLERIVTSPMYCFGRRAKAAADHTAFVRLDDAVYPCMAPPSTVRRRGVSRPASISLSQRKGGIT
jgi:hypothetical protein